MHELFHASPVTTHTMTGNPPAANGPRAAADTSGASAIPSDSPPAGHTEGGGGRCGGASGAASGPGERLRPPAPAASPKRRRVPLAPAERPHPLDCAICLQRMTCPVVTPCGHSFCAACLERYLSSAPHPQPCPTCPHPLRALHSPVYPNLALARFLVMSSHSPQRTPTHAPESPAVCGNADHVNQNGTTPSNIDNTPATTTATTTCTAAAAAAAADDDSTIKNNSSNSKKANHYINHFHPANNHHRLGHHHSHGRISVMQQLASSGDTTTGVLPGHYAAASNRPHTEPLESPSIRLAEPIRPTNPSIAAVLALPALPPSYTKSCIDASKSAAPVQNPDPDLDIRSHVQRMSETDAEVLLRALLERTRRTGDIKFIDNGITSLGDSIRPDIGAELTLAFLARAHIARRAAKDAAERDLAVIHDDIARLITRGSYNAGSTLPVELRAEIKMISAAALGPLPDSTGALRQDASLPSNLESNYSPDAAPIRIRNAMAERFHPDLEASYLGSRASRGQKSLETLTNTLVQATRLSSARKCTSVAHVDIMNGGQNNLISSVEINTTGRLLAAAGVTKRIKIFDLDTLLSAREVGADEDANIHFPLIEIPTVFKLSCMSWNRDRAPILAAADFSGAVAVYDTEVNTRLHSYTEHAARAWSVDFSTEQPNLMVSGSDDKYIKLWDVGRMSQSALSLASTANVCSVKFNPYTCHELACGSADHKVYSYDIRHPRTPLCVFEGHWRAVSYVLFLNRSELISASTDSSCKLWNVREQEPGLSYGGHVNERHFVGLSSDGDFFACGSEDNAVYVYHKGLSGPVVRHGLDSFGSFASSICWKQNSNSLVAANNIGTLEVVELS
jgi:WD40 repeat protein